MKNDLCSDCLSKNILFFPLIFILFFCFLTSAYPWIEPEFIKVWEDNSGTPSSEEVASTWKEPLTGMVFVKIPKGCFLMGSPYDDKARETDEGPVHQACVDSFWMGQFEVTNKEYKKFKPHHDSTGYKEISLNEPNQPVVEVSWEDARAFIKWLNTKSHHTFRLPTEAEWEYACRGGCNSTQDCNPVSETVCNYANGFDITAFKRAANNKKGNPCDCDDKFVVSSPVGSFKPNNFGLYDMLGNVWELCRDTYATPAYSLHTKDNPLFKGDGYKRVRRGGAWYSGITALRCANRHYQKPDAKSIIQGFRIVREE